MAEKRFYEANTKDEKIKPPKGSYDAVIVGLDIIEDVHCGVHIADIYKPHYKLIDENYKGLVVKDNGVFRYKKKQGYEYNPKRNWGYNKFTQLLDIPKNTSNNRGSITFDVIDGWTVVIELTYKTFVNEMHTQVSYPVATLQEKKSEAPF
jgi:hypothetical protein